MTTQLAFEDETKRSRGFRGCWLGVDISGAGIAAMVLGAISMAFDAAALGTRHWAYGKVTPDRLREVNMGLFEYCEGNRCSMCTFPFSCVSPIQLPRTCVRGDSACV